MLRVEGIFAVNMAAGRRPANQYLKYVRKAVMKKQMFDTSGGAMRALFRRFSVRAVMRAGVACLLGVAVFWTFFELFPGAFSGTGAAHAALREPTQSFRDGSPEFPWSSFQRFWNVRCLPGCEIQDPQYVGGRYIVAYGRSVSLVVAMERGIVRKVTALYADPRGSQGGGQIWLKLADSIIRVGTFRWPPDRIERVRERFVAITDRPADYKWQSSWFQRSRNQDGSWSFSIDFLPYTVSDGD